MDQSDFGKDESTLREIAKAQKTLDEVESKMKNFKSRKRQSTNSALPKAPYPDLNKFFSYLSEEQDQYDETLNQCGFSKDLTKDEGAKATKYRPEFNSVIGQQNNSLSLNQKLEKEKKSSISKIEEYYMERNEALEQRIRELKEFKEKFVRDQKLLVRNNGQLEQEIQKKRRQNIDSIKLEELKAKVQKMRKKINDIERDNLNIIKSKQQMEKHIRQALRGHKINLKNDLQVRPKSNSQARYRLH